MLQGNYLYSRLFLYFPPCRNLDILSFVHLTSKAILPPSSKPTLFKTQKNLIILQGNTERHEHTKFLIFIDCASCEVTQKQLFAFLFVWQDRCRLFAEKIQIDIQDFLFYVVKNPPEAFPILQMEDFCLPSFLHIPSSIGAPREQPHSLLPLYFHALIPLLL